MYYQRNTRANILKMNKTRHEKQLCEANILKALVSLLLDAPMVDSAVAQYARTRF